MKKCNEWIFTFGCGQPNAGHCVRVKGNLCEAREKMYEKYGEEWAFQYSLDEWEEFKKNPQMFPMETEIPF